MNGLWYFVRHKQSLFRFEEGTPPFQQIIALKHGFQMLEKQGCKVAFRTTFRTKVKQFLQEECPP